MKIKLVVTISLILVFSTGRAQNSTGLSSLSSQTPGPQDPVIEKILVEEKNRSQLYPLAQELLDSIGPRLTGSVEQKRAVNWALDLYKKWGIPVRAEQYGTWIAWRRGSAHIDLTAPRTRPLEGMLSTWSPGTRGTVEGPVVLFPKIQNAAEFEASLPQVKGKFVLFSFPWPSCRPDSNWKEFATPESYELMQKERTEAFDAWYAGRLRKAGVRGRDLVKRLADAGALGILTILVPPPSPQGWGVDKMSTTISDSIPELGFSCEDYTLLFRLAENNQGPIIRVDANAEFAGEVPVSNVIAELRGHEKPNEFVVLSAHLDSWDPASGATDNGSGTLVMMEAMRILKTVYPNPKRTILVGHWSGEEQGLNGSGAFATDHPEVVSGLQVLFNQDSGTGRVAKISMQGFLGAAPFFRRWFSQMPSEMTREIHLIDPGTPGSATDSATFICYGAPAFELSSVPWDYEAYTWHTSLDTFDKLVLADLKSNAALVAMLAYLASEDAERLPHEPRVTATNPKTGQSAPWPTCKPPARNWRQYQR